MALMMGAFYDALIDAGASEVKARAAAEEAAGTTEEFASVRSEIQVLGSSLRSEVQSLGSNLRAEQSAIRSDLKLEIEGLRSQVNIIRWMLGFNLATTVAILFLLLRLFSQP